MKSNNRKKSILFWVILVSMMIFFLIWFFVIRVAAATKQFPMVSYIGRVEVSSLTKDQAVKRIATELTSGNTEAKLVLTHNNQSWEFRGSEFEVLNPTRVLVEASHQTAKQAVREASLESLHAQSPNLKAPLPIRLALGGLSERLQELKSQIETPPIEGSVQFLPDSEQKFVVTPPVNGKKINYDLLYQKIDSLFESNNQIALEIPIIEVPASETSSQQQQRLQLRSSFRTEFDAPSSGRGKNIALALAKVNGLVLQPNKEFSFNQTVGSFGEDNGFHKAKIIFNGEFVDAFGGGACQASSTVFNAALLANLKITESHNHSLQVGYVRQGFDAMVSNGTSDLRFENNSGHPIYLAARVEGNEAVVEVFGKPLPKGMKIDRRNEVIKTIPHKGDKIIRDENGEFAKHVIYQGEFYRLKHPKDGYETKSHIDIYMDGKLISSTLLRKNTYLPQQGIIMEGNEELPAFLKLPKTIA